MAAVLLKTDFAPNEGLDRSSVVELWHVYDVLGWTADNTTDVVFSQTRTLGASHPDIGRAICKNRVLRRRWSDGTSHATDGTYWQALVSVYFDSSNRETAFNPRSTVIDPITERVSIPFWSLPPGRITKRLNWYHADRARIRRAETRHPRTAQVTEQARNTIFSQIGAVYFFGQDNGPIIDPNPVGIPYIFKGPRIVDLQNGLTRIVYYFETESPLLGIPVDRFGAGIPCVQTDSLDYLDEYVPPDDDPPIRVSRWNHRYLAGTGLPFL